MLASRTRTLLVAAICVFGLTSTLAACSETAPTKSAGSGSDSAKTGTTKSDGAASDVVLKGTGRYAIGTEAPLGGYQLTGEPDEQPSGCTWSIQDADGEKSFENQGSYAFLTDVHESVTFVTEGCPDWQKFE